MSEELLYERYKNALRTGHIAAIRGRLEAALAAYAEAAALAPDRPLPHSSTGRVLLRLGRVEEALAAYAAALSCAPRDEAALVGRADALIAAGRPAEAAGVLDLLSETHEAAGRTPEACDTAREALELAESRARRRHLESLVAELRRSAGESGGDERLIRALRALETPVAAPAAAPPATASGGASAAQSGAAVVPAAVAEGPAPDPGDLISEVEVVVETGDPTAVHEVVLRAVAALRRAGLLDAAGDACQLGLTVSPADPDVHLALAELDLDHGWIDMAADKLAILGRLVELTADEPARQRLCAIVSERFPEDPRLTAICA